MDTLNRVQKIIKAINLSERAFAIRCGIKPSTLDMQLNGNRALSLKTIQAVLLAFPDISAEWLLRDQGEMLRKPTSASLDINRIATLLDTIATLQDTINEKNKTIQSLTEKLNLTKSN